MEFIIFIITIICGLFFGKRAEKKHYSSIIEREEKYKSIVILSDKDLKRVKNTSGEGILLSGTTVVSIDAFKKFMSSFVNLFGGKMKSYESLVDRARREAILKVKQQAYEKNLNCIVNLRVETSSISKNAKQNVGAVEALVYATGIQVI